MPSAQEKSEVAANYAAAVLRERASHTIEDASTLRVLIRMIY